MSRQNVKATATAMENASVENAFVKLASKAPFVKQNWSVPRLPTDENAAAMVNASMATAFAMLDGAGTVAVTAFCVARTATAMADATTRNVSVLWATPAVLAKFRNPVRTNAAVMGAVFSTTAFAKLVTAEKIAVRKTRNCPPAAGTIALAMASVA